MSNGKQHSTANVTVTHEDRRKRSRIGIIEFDDIDTEAFRALPNGARVVYFTLLTYINRGNGKAWPTQRTLARVTGKDAAVVSKAIKLLDARGFVTREVSRSGMSYVYAVTSPPEGPTCEG